MRNHEVIIELLNGEIKKDKSSEKSGRPRQEATDLSDANDNPIWGMFRYYLNNMGMVYPQLIMKSS